MPYTPPTFNLVCNIGPQGAFPPTWRLTDVSCALIYGRRDCAVVDGLNAYGFPAMTGGMFLAMPALTDIRGLQDTINPDYVEVPAGSGRYYAVNFVDDVGKGWANEFRQAVITAVGGTWTAPYP